MNNKIVREAGGNNNNNGINNLEVLGEGDEHYELSNKLRAEDEEIEDDEEEEEE